MEPRLIKIDRNGSKHYEGRVKCDRCGGDGIYKWGAMINGRPQYIGTCFKCEGAGWAIDKWIERTPEYQAKLDAARQAKCEAKQAARAEREEQWRKEREERERLEAERKAISQHIGSVGDKLTKVLTYTGSASWQQRSYGGFGTETHYAHKFVDEAGNVLVWKTTASICWSGENGQWISPEPGDKVSLSGRIKEHGSYNDEKQTVLTRCKTKPA